MKVMTNLWGFEKQVTLSRMSGGRFGLMQTTRAVDVVVRTQDGSNTRPVTVNVPLNTTRGLDGTEIQAIAQALHLSEGETIDSIRYEDRARGHHKAPATPSERAQIERAARTVTAPAATQPTNTVDRLPISEEQQRYQQHLDTVRNHYAADMNGLNDFLGRTGDARMTNPSSADFRQALQEAQTRANSLTGADQRNARARLEGIRSRFESTNSHLMDAVQQAERQINLSNPNYTQATSTLEAAERQWINNSHTEAGGGNGSQAGAGDTNAPSAEERRMRLQSQLEAESQARVWAREDAVSARQQATQAQAFAASRPNDVAQVIGSIMNPIAGTFASLGTAAAMASWGGNCYSGIGGLGGCGTNPLLPMTVASTFMNGGFGCGGGFNAIGGAGGGMGGGFGGLDLIGMGNTFYGQALDERSRARVLDAEINRLKAMIMMGNFDAILQAVTLLTLKSKGMLRQSAVAMINSVQNSNRQMEEQNRRLEALASSGPNSSGSSNNQNQMLVINNNIQGINMDRQTAMNALKDMTSNLEEATSSEANIRRSFEQIRQIQNRA